MNQNKPVTNEEVARKIVKGWAPECSSLTDDIKEALDNLQKEIEERFQKSHEAELFQLKAGLCLEINDLQEKLSQKEGEIEKIRREGLN